MKRRRMVLAVVLAVAVLVVICECLSRRWLDARPELAQAQDFLVSSTNVIDEFGGLEDVRYQRAGSSVTQRGEAFRGRYRFMVHGSRRSGELAVDWQSRGNGADFKANCISEIENWRDPRVIWRP